MKQFLSDNLNLILKLIVTAILLSTLFAFGSFTTDFFDTPKFVVLAVLTLAMLVILTIRFAVSGKVSFTRTPLDLPLLLLLSVAVVSTILSPAPFVSLLGNQARVHGSLVALIAYILFYFLAVQAIKSLKDIRWILHLGLFSSAILALWGLANYFGIAILPFSFTKATNFTPTGSSFSTTGILAIFLPFVLIQIFAAKKLAAKIAWSALLSILGLFIMLTGSWPVWVASLIGTGAVFLTIRPSLRSFNLLFVAIPVVIMAFVFIFSITPPIGENAQNPIYEKARNFPRELQLPLEASWKISVSAFRDSPFWGSGPATFLFNFTQHKPIEFNQTKIWNLRFDNAFNEYLQVLATLGGVGFFALLSATIIFASGFYRAVYLNRHSENSDLLTGLSICGLVFFVLILLHPSTMVIWIIGLLILACFTASSLKSGEDISQGRSFGAILQNAFPLDGGRTTIHVEALSSILLVISALLTLAVFFFGGKFVLADYHHRKALNAVAQNQGLDAYNSLVKAELLNPVSDFYRIDIAQINFALANAIASAKSGAAGQDSLTEEDKKNIQTLLQQSISEGRIAVTLSPKNPINWEILAQLYRQISGVAQNALVFSLDAYGRAIMLDPLNPILRLNVGGTYYAIKNYDLAIRFFTDSINLKPDYANGYYNTSVALRDKGDLQGALTTAQKVVELVDKDSPDFKIASDYLNDLKSKSEAQNPETNLQAPTASDKGALQQKELPKVVNVGNPPEKIATPEAIKKPSPTPSPQP